MSNCPNFTICVAWYTDAFVVVAGKSGGAIDVGPAPLGARDALADLVRVTLRVRGADILAEGPDAERVGGAVGVDTANGLAEAVVTLEVVLWTLLVGLALDRLARASNGRRRVWEESLLADAVGLAVDPLAVGIRTAAGNAARVDAAVGDARLGRGAVGLLAAAYQTHLVETDMSEEAVVIHTASHCSGKMK